MGRRKHKSVHKHPLCSVCRVSNLSSPFSIPRCSSCLALSRHTICDSCLHKHIFITISQDITKQVICPEEGCNAKLTNAIIKAALVASNHQVLWEEYELKCNWRGTSEQWIKRFAARCPGCLVPIEKNGGCNQVVCKQCRMVFNWQHAKNSYLFKIRIWWKRCASLVAALFYKVFQKSAV